MRVESNDTGALSPSERAFADELPKLVEGLLEAGAESKRQEIAERIVWINRQAVEERVAARLAKAAPIHIPEPLRGQLLDHSYKIDAFLDAASVVAESRQLDSTISWLLAEAQQHMTDMRTKIEDGARP